jgi:hypothetical protein
VTATPGTYTKPDPSTGRVRERLAATAVEAVALAFDGWTPKTPTPAEPAGKASKAPAPAAGGDKS